MKTPLKYISPFLLFFFAFLSVSPGSRTNKRNFYFRNENVKPLSQLSTDYNPYYIIISKRKYELRVYDNKGWYATYPCVFGSSDFRDKYMAGDKRTPDGNFKIILKRNNTKWKYELLLNYPNAESYKKFDERKAEGLIPKNASIGGGIAIHATRPQEEWTVDYYQNWTDGCISLKYHEAADLYSYIPVGTPVTIEK